MVVEKKGWKNMGKVLILDDDAYPTDSCQICRKKITEIGDRWRKVTWDSEKRMDVNQIVCKNCFHGRWTASEQENDFRRIIL
jgi:cytidine deaminase